MGASPDNIVSAKNKLRKFLRRTEDDLGEPVKSLRDSETGQLSAMKLHFQRSDSGDYRLTSISQTSLEKRLIDSVIVELRVFFLSKEDCFLPGIVKALQSLSPHRARALDPLKNHVASVIRNGGLVSPEGEAGMYSGRLEMDNGLGPGRLLGSDQIAMDYIYGLAIHEDDVRRARLENVSDMDSILFAVVIQLDRVLRVVESVRAQALHDIETGYFTLDLVDPESKM